MGHFTHQMPKAPSASCSSRGACCSSHAGQESNVRLKSPTTSLLIIIKDLSRSTGTGNPTGGKKSKARTSKMRGNRRKSSISKRGPGRAMKGVSLISIPFNRACLQRILEPNKLQPKTGPCLRVLQCFRRLCAEIFHGVACGHDVTRPAADQRFFIATFKNFCGLLKAGGKKRKLCRHVHHLKSGREYSIALCFVGSDAVVFERRWPILERNLHFRKFSWPFGCDLADHYIFLGCQEKSRVPRRNRLVLPPSFVGL